MDLFQSLDVIAILKYGVPGVVFLLAVMSFGLLQREQGIAEGPRAAMLTSIRHFQYVNMALAVLTLIPLLPVFSTPQPSESTFDLTARLEPATGQQGVASVCAGASYANRYLLVRDSENGSLVQVFAGRLQPCPQREDILLSGTDAAALGWKGERREGTVSVVVASPGYKFTI